MASQDVRNEFLTAIEALHGSRLRRFLASRLRNGMADVPDMVQEVYLRLLRVEEPETIESPEAYVLTIAKHVLYEHHTRRTPTTGAASIDLFANWLESDPERSPEALVATAERIDSVQRVLAGMSHKAQAALILHRVEGLNLEQIGQRLGISRSMAKKYLARALAQCRLCDEGNQ